MKTTQQLSRQNNFRINSTGNYPAGKTEEYSEQWCIKYPDDTWQVFYGGGSGPAAYKYPSTNLKTYF